MSNNIDNLINWSELSRFLTQGDRGAIRPGKIWPKHVDQLDIFFGKQLPEMWEKKKQELDLIVRKQKKTNP